MLEKKLINNYHYLAFNKVKFSNDLSNILKIINHTNNDIYFFHLLFPHKPHVFDINLKEKKCFFEEKYLNNSFFKTEVDFLEQHYKEIICTNIYLDSFLEKLSNNLVSKNEFKIILLSDTGYNPYNIKKSKDDQFSLKNKHSVFFAIKDVNKKFYINKSFIPSQKIFSSYLNKQNNYIEKDKIDNKIYSINENDYIKIDKFRN